MAKAMDGITGAMSKATEHALKHFADAQGRSRRNAVPLIFGDDARKAALEELGDDTAAVAGVRHRGQAMEAGDAQADGRLRVRGRADEPEGRGTPAPWLGGTSSSS